MIIQDWKRDFFTIPNYLSLFRLLLIPIYVIIYWKASQPEEYAVAAGILAVSCLTDAIDGQIARRFHMVSSVGKFLDPLADKATQITLTVCLSIRYPILWTLVGIFVLKEGFQLIAGIVEFRKGRMLIGALLSGKICTAILFISLILMVLIPNLPPWIILIMTFTDGIFMLISFLHYAWTYYRKTAMIQDIQDPEE